MTHDDITTLMYLAGIIVTGIAGIIVAQISGRANGKRENMKVQAQNAWLIERHGALQDGVTSIQQQLPPGGLWQWIETTRENTTALNSIAAAVERLSAEQRKQWERLDDYHAQVEELRVVHNRVIAAQTTTTTVSAPVHEVE